MSQYPITILSIPNIILLISIQTLSPPHRLHPFHLPQYFQRPAPLAALLAARKRSGWPRWGATSRGASKIPVNNGRFWPLNMRSLKTNREFWLWNMGISWDLTSRDGEWIMNMVDFAIKLYMWRLNHEKRRNLASKHADVIIYQPEMFGHLWAVHLTNHRFLWQCSTIDMSSGT